MPKITLGITGLHKILGRDYGIEEPHWGPSYRYSIRLSRCDVLKKRVVLLPIWAHSTTVVTLCGPRLYEENLSRVEESFAYPIHSRTGEPTFPTILYKRVWIGLTDATSDKGRKILLTTDKMIKKLPTTDRKNITDYRHGLFVSRKKSILHFFLGRK